MRSVRNSGYCVLVAALLSLSRGDDRAGDAIDERVAVLLEAAPAELDRVRSETSEEDFRVIADDLMFFRAAAQEYLEARGVPVVRVVDGRRLTFLVAGRPREYDFSGEPTLDVVVLYDPGREPKAIAPIDIEEADEYFGLDSQSGPVQLRPRSRL